MGTVIGRASFRVGERVCAHVPLQWPDSSELGHLITPQRHRAGLVSSGGMSFQQPPAAFVALLTAGPTTCTSAYSECTYFTFPIPMRYFHSIPMIPRRHINSRRDARPWPLQTESGRAGAVGCCLGSVFRFSEALKYICLNQSLLPYLPSIVLPCVASPRAPL